MSKGHGKGRTKEDGPKNLLRSPRRLQALISRGDLRVATITGYADGVSRARERWRENGYDVATEVLEWEESE